MADTTVKKVNAPQSPAGNMGQIYLVAGKRMSMRMWKEMAPTDQKPARSRPYETVGYVLEGLAELELNGQTVRLEPGDAWLVPADAEHTYHVLEPFTAIETTSPPARVSGRDE